MRFRFCGDLDCPDWVLAEISILSKISSVKMKLFCQQVVNKLLKGEVDYEKVNKYTADAKFELDDVKAALAAVDFIFTSSGKHGVDGETLSNELQQLGLPKELATALCKVYSDKRDSLHNVLYEQSMRSSKLKSVDWRVDYVLSSSSSDDINDPEVQLNVNRILNGFDETFSFTCSSDKFRMLLTDLKDVYKRMEDLS